MAHVHLEDGAFSLFWVIVWTAVALCLIWIAIYGLGRRGGLTTRKMAIAAMCVAIGFAIFQIEIPIPFVGAVHMNLTPLIGILVGPGLGSLCILIINIFSAAIGHGGWGMIGANTLVNLIEVVMGFYLYRLLRSTFKLGRFPSGFGAATTALVVSAFAVVAIVTVSGIQDSAQSAEGTLGNMLLLAAVNVVAAVIEGVVTGYIVSFIGRVRPDLLPDQEHAPGREDGESTKEAIPDV
jgi:cobalt/nickel transport system permease protein